ncbi:phosphotransferase [Streptomyces acidiscabies]|uniref:phosphotransferase n=1 Tax=Streptomyces acidiscabies TaxID=42234 RepID=UPI0009536898|nr:phosphotransferase [Streptomyces acidiscabies]
MTSTFTKRYPTPETAASAARNYAWLATHALPMRQPALTEIGDTTLTFAHIEGRHAGPDDLLYLAALLGNAHGAAWRSTLHRAELTEPYSFDDGTPFGAYLAPREEVLRERRRQGFLPSDDALASMLEILRQGAEGPAAFYKDCNLRNFLTTDDYTVFTVDPDQLTLAPFGYDLAKLVLSMVMTCGPMPTGLQDEVLAMYNKAAGHHDARLGTTSRARFNGFLALHAVLTAPYAGRHGYRPHSPSPEAP